MAISVWRQEAAAALLVLFALHVSAEPASTAQPAYDILQRHGLLPRTAPPTTSSAVAKSPSQPSLHNERVVISSSTASAPVPRPALALVKPAPVSEAASAAEPPPSALTRAYNLLRLKGLLPGVPGSTSTAYVPPGRARHGAERVVVSQLHRSPGVFFGQSYHANGTKLYSARIIPFKGSWIEFATDINNVMYAYIDRKKKLPVTTLFRAIGFERDKDILEIFGLAEEVMGAGWCTPANFRIGASGLLDDLLRHLGDGPAKSGAATY